MGLGNNQIKDIIKVTRTLENRRILLKETTGKKHYPRRRIIRLFGQLMKFGLQLMKNVFTPLAKKVLMSLGLMEAVAGTDAAISKKVFG